MLEGNPGDADITLLEETATHFEGSHVSSARYAARFSGNASSILFLFEDLFSFKNPYYLYKGHFRGMMPLSDNSVSGSAETQGLIYFTAVSGNFSVSFNGSRIGSSVLPSVRLGVAAAALWQGCSSDGV